MDLEGPTWLTYAVDGQDRRCVVRLAPGGGGVVEWEFCKQPPGGRKNSLLGVPNSVLVML